MDSQHSRRERNCKRTFSPRASVGCASGVGEPAADRAPPDAAGRKASGDCCTCAVSWMQVRSAAGDLCQDISRVQHLPCGIEYTMLDTTTGDLLDGTAGGGRSPPRVSHVIPPGRDSINLLSSSPPTTVVRAQRIDVDILASSRLVAVDAVLAVYDAHWRPRVENAL